MNIRYLLEEISSLEDQFSDDLVEVAVDNIHRLTRSLFEFISDLTLDDRYWRMHSEDVEALVRETIADLYDVAVSDIYQVDDDAKDVMVEILEGHINTDLVSVGPPGTHRRDRVGISIHPVIRSSPG